MKANRKAEQYLEKIKRWGEKVRISIYKKRPKGSKEMINWLSKYVKITDSEKMIWEVYCDVSKLTKKEFCVKKQCLCIH